MAFPVEFKKGPALVYKVDIPYYERPHLQELIDEKISDSNLKLTVTPPGVSFMEALPEIVPEIDLRVYYKTPIHFKPDNNGFPPIHPENIREIALIFSGLKKSYITAEGEKSFLSHKVKLWIGTIPGHVSCGPRGGANFIVESILVKRRKKGGIVRVKASEKIEDRIGLVNRRDLTMEIKRKDDDICELEYSLG